MFQSYRRGYSNLLELSKSKESIGLGCEYCQFWLKKYYIHICTIVIIPSIENSYNNLNLDSKEHEFLVKSDDKNCRVIKASIGVS